MRELKKKKEVKLSNTNYWLNRGGRAVRPGRIL